MEKMNAEKEVELLSKRAVRPKVKGTRDGSNDRHKSADRNRSTDRSSSVNRNRSIEGNSSVDRNRSVDRSNSSIRPSRSDTCQADKKGKKNKEGRSKSESRIKELAHRTLSETREKFLGKTETGKKVVNGIEKAVGVAREAREIVRAITDLQSSDDLSSGDEDDGDIFGAGIQMASNMGAQAQAQASTFGDMFELENQLQSMELDDPMDWSRKREREEQPSHDSPPRKSMTPEPRPLSSIYEANDEAPGPVLDFGAEATRLFEAGELDEDDEEVLAEVIMLSDQIVADSREKDKVIESLRAKLATQQADFNKMVAERDDELRSLTEKEKEAAKVIDRLKRDLAEARTAYSEAEHHINTLTMRMDDEQEETRSKCQELRGRAEAARTELAESKREVEKMHSALVSLKAEIRTGKDSFDKMEANYVGKMEVLNLALECAKEEARKLASRFKEEKDKTEARYSRVAQGLSNYRSGLRRTASTTGRKVLAIDGEASSSEEEEEEVEYEEEEEERDPGEKYRPQEIKAMRDNLLVWPRYEDAHDHSDFVDNCQRAANRAINRGMPKQHVATALNVMIERLHQCVEKFNALRGDDDEDKPLAETLEMLRQCDPDPTADGAARFRSTVQKNKNGRKEVIESYMKRITTTHDKHLTAKGDERKRNIKKQFFRGLLRKPIGIEGSMATCMDLAKVATATRQMIEDAAEEDLIYRDQKQDDRSRQKRPQGGRYGNAFNHNQGFAQSRPARNVAAVTDSDDVVSTTGEVPKQQTDERAETSREFQDDVVVCRNCRMMGSHYTRQCPNAPFCSMCKQEGHRDEHCGVTKTQPKQQQQQQQQQRSHAWGNGRSWGDNAGRGSYRNRNGRNRGSYGNGNDSRNQRSGDSGNRPSFGSDGGNQQSQGGFQQQYGSFGPYKGGASQQTQGQEHGAQVKADERGAMGGREQTMA